MISTHTKSASQPEAPTRNKLFGYVIHDLAKQLRRHFDTTAQQFGLTLAQWRLIAQISANEGLSQVALAALVDTDPMTVSGLIERLEGKGLVERITDPDDSRAKIVLLTDKARGLVAEMKQIAEKVSAELFDGITEAERVTALKVLQQMSANLSKQRAPGKEELV